MLKGERSKKVFLRCAALVLVLLSAAFGGVFSMGENLFEALGLRVWSEGSEGYYYPGILALILFIAGSAMFAATTKNWKKTLYYILAGVLLISIVLWVI